MPAPARLDCDEESSGNIYLSTLADLYHACPAFGGLQRGTSHGHRLAHADGTTLARATLFEWLIESAGIIIGVVAATYAWVMAAGGRRSR